MTLVNKFEHYLVDLLQGHITYNGTSVQVTKNLSENPTLPVITLDTGIQTTTNNVKRFYHDNEELVYERESEIQVNVWCNTEAQRQSINNQVMNCWYAEQNNHYTYCSQYSSGVCSTSHETCDATLSTTRRAIGGRCPLPDAREYESLRYKYGIIQSSMNIDPPFDMDEIGEHPPLLRSIFRATAGYYDVVPGPEIPVQEIVIDDVEDNDDLEII